jgi:hypothetical protein
LSPGEPDDLPEGHRHHLRRTASGMLSAQTTTPLRLVSMASVRERIGPAAFALDLVEASFGMPCRRERSEAGQ